MKRIDDIRVQAGMGLRATSIDDTRFLLAEVDRLTAENERLTERVKLEADINDNLAEFYEGIEAWAVRAEQAIQRVEKELAEWDRIGYPTDPDPQAAVRAALAGEDSTDEK